MPIISQIYINYILANFINIFCIIYFNNIFIYLNLKKNIKNILNKSYFIFASLNFY